MLCRVMNASAGSSALSAGLPTPSPAFLVVTVKMMPGYSITIPNATVNTMDIAVPGHKLNLDKTLSQKLKRPLRT